jgi:hypothetical protein
MKIITLINKLNKMKIENKIVDNNGYNKDVVFVINGKTFYAGFTMSNDTIIDYCVNICYDASNQETQRRFFDNLNQLLKYAGYKGETE